MSFFDRNIPVDTNGLTFTVASPKEIQPVKEYANGTATGSFQLDERGVTLYRIPVQVANAEKMETVQIKAPLAAPPVWALGRELTVSGLTANPVGDRQTGRVTTYMSAASVEPVSAPDAKPRA